MRMTARALRTSIITATAATAITLGAASGALAATHHTPSGATAETVVRQAAAKRGYVKTVRLASKGHVAKVYKLGAGKYQADVLFKGKRVTTLSAFGTTTTANLNGLHVSLTAKGAVTSWVDRAKPAPKPKPKPKPTPGRELVRIDSLSDGSAAKIYKLSASHWQAVITAGSVHGNHIGTLDANGRSAAANNNGLHVILNPDGTLTSWTDTGAPAPEPAPAPAPQPEPVPDPVPAPNPSPDPVPAPAPDTADSPAAGDHQARPKAEHRTQPAPAPVAPSADPGHVELSSAG